MWKWSWRRLPRGREIGELEELNSLIHGKGPRRGRIDKARWCLDSEGEFSTQKLKEKIEEKLVVQDVGETKWLKPRQTSTNLVWTFIPHFAQGAEWRWNL